MRLDPGLTRVLRREHRTGSYHDRMRKAIKMAGWCLAGCGVVAPALAEQAAVVEFGKDYLIGAALTSSTAHMGQTENNLRLKPVFAFQLGRLRVSRSRANVIMSAGRGEGVETGVSTELLSRQNWSLSASLRLDNGRSFEGDPRWEGLPDIQDTVRGRVSARRSLGARWSTSVSFDHDLLDKDGGGRLLAGLGYRLPQSDRAHWDFSASGSWGSSRYMQTHYGISSPSLALVGSRAYTPGSGPESLQLGIDYTHALGENWVAFGGVGFSRLVRPAAASPLIDRKSTYGMSVGLAWRSSR